MEMSCVKNLTREGMSITREAIKKLQEEFEVEVSKEIVCLGLCRQDLHAQVKQKKPILSMNNIKACLKFAKKHEF